MSTDPLIGKQLSNFKIERLVGKGGMGQVYYGRDVRLNRPVAIKVIGSLFRKNPSYAKRFAQEAQTVAAWRHENIAHVYHADEQDDVYYFAMEYIDGLDLGEILLHYTSKGELIPQADALRIGRAIANALDYAHVRGVVHRDVKPSNVLVAQDGRVVLTDFGLALDTQQGSVGEVFGTAHYIAPEQARRSSEAIPQSDIYSLGIVLYEMLTGSVPFDDPSPTSVALQHIMDTPPTPRSLNPKLNEATESVLLQALAKAPPDRYQSGKLLMDALENAMQHGDGLSEVTLLPPMPVGTLSRMPGVGDEPVPPTAAAPTHQPVIPPASAHTTPTKPSRRPALWMIFGGCFLVLAVVLVVGAALLLGRLAGLLRALPAQPAATQVSALNAGLTPENTSTPQGEPNVLSAETPTVQVPSTPVQTPTVLYPNGKHFTIFYDDDSLFFLNRSQSDVPINWVAFERLSNADTPSNRFNGARWGQFYGTITAGRCMAIEILDSGPYLDPPACGGSKNYLSLRTPTRDDETVFWTAQAGGHQFRVLWRQGGQDIEVARCEIGGEICEVYLP